MIVGQSAEMQRAIRTHFDELLEDVRRTMGSTCRSRSSSLRGESRDRVVATVTVRGVGEARTSPDEASVTLTIEAIEQKAAAALAKVAERTQAALELCDSLGIEPAARVTSGASIAEHGEHDREGRWQHRGYRAWNQIVARVGEASVVGELIAGAVDRGAQVSGPAWTIAPDNPARVEACKEAALDARRRAEAYADALGVRVGAIVAVRDPGRAFRRLRARCGWRPWTQALSRRSRWRPASSSSRPPSRSSSSSNRDR
jgi:uncharacterized protein YggE